MQSQFLPKLISWNTTLRCNLRCKHCYINAMDENSLTFGELTTKEGFNLIEQIAEVSKPILILTGGEPLLREDIYDLAKFGTEKRLRVVLGTNGTLITDSIAKKLIQSGVKRVAISCDSIMEETHDDFRGKRGARKSAIDGMLNAKKNGLALQINTTVTKENYNEIEEIIALADEVGADEMHLFFLVPTGRGENLPYITPYEYEKMLLKVYEWQPKFKIHVKPSCAPQFMRIEKQKGLQSKYSRGCIAGLSYLRITPNGEVHPCPYMPLKVGSIREKSFKEIWFNAIEFKNLRNFKNLKGKCSYCEFVDVCGGCRARAFALKNDYLQEEPWCVYVPKKK